MKRHVGNVADRIFAEGNARLYSIFADAIKLPIQMNISFRQQAREALSRAQDELASNSEQRLKYAALELRMAMECLTYERARGYAREMPPTEYETWQPRKLMMMMLEIDPKADKDSSIAVGIEDVPGQEAKVMTSLGTEKVLNLSAIKDHYDALGSYLHTPTLKQLESGKGLNYVRLRERCAQIAGEVEATLQSKVWNINFGTFSEITCMHCDSPVRKRITGPSAIARCFTCNATYEVKETPEKRLTWRTLRQVIPCQAPGCGEDMVVLDADVEAGKSVKCVHCSALHSIDLTISLDRHSMWHAQTSPLQNQ